LFQRNFALVLCILLPKNSPDDLCDILFSPI
jgi:hypothetical protein